MLLYSYSWDDTNYEALDGTDVTPATFDWDVLAEAKPLASTWKPIRVASYRTRKTRPTDFPFVNGYVPVFSSRAWKVLQPLAGKCVEALPLICDLSDGPYYAINVLAKVDCLDSRRSKGSRLEDGSLYDVDYYVLKPNSLKNCSPIFKMVGLPAKVFFTEEFKQTVERNQLQGVLYSPLRMRDPEKGRPSRADLKKKTKRTGSKEPAKSLVEAVNKLRDTLTGMATNKSAQKKFLKGMLKGFEAFGRERSARLQKVAETARELGADVAKAGKGKDWADIQGLEELPPLLKSVKKKPLKAKQALDSFLKGVGQLPSLTEEVKEHGFMIAQYVLQVPDRDRYDLQQLEPAITLGMDYVGPVMEGMAQELIGVTPETLGKVAGTILYFAVERTILSDVSSNASPVFTATATTELSKALGELVADARSP